MTRNDEAVGLTGASETVTARAGLDEAVTRGDKPAGTGSYVAVVVIRAGNSRTAARPASGLRNRPHC